MDYINIQCPLFCDKRRKYLHVNAGRPSLCPFRDWRARNDCRHVIRFFFFFLRRVASRRMNSIVDVDALYNIYKYIYRLNNSASQANPPVDQPLFISSQEGGCSEFFFVGRLLSKSALGRRPHINRRGNFCDKYGSKGLRARRWYRRALDELVLSEEDATRERVGNQRDWLSNRCSCSSAFFKKMLLLRFPRFFFQIQKWWQLDDILSTPNGLKKNTIRGFFFQSADGFVAWGVTTAQ